MAHHRTERLRLEIHHGRWPQLGRYLRAHVPDAVKLARVPLAELSIVIVGDREICRLHQQFFGDPATTDVITFPLDLDGKGRALSGELYLCAPMARRQARLRASPVAHEILLYAVHGVLHLGGYDDRTAAAYSVMHRKEDSILRKLGVGAVFALSPRSAG